MLGEDPTGVDARDGPSDGVCVSVGLDWTRPGRTTARSPPGVTRDGPIDGRTTAFFTVGRANERLADGLAAVETRLGEYDGFTLARAAGLAARVGAARAAPAVGRTATPLDGADRATGAARVAPLPST